MRLRNLILLVLAVVLAGGTALLARSYLAAQRVQQVVRAAPPPPPPEHQILVARVNLARGQLLNANDLRWQVWPDNAIAQSYIESGGKVMPQSFSGWVAVAPVAEGAPITRTMIISPGSGGFLAAVLQPGMRAIQAGTAGQLPDGTEPGDRVDMIVEFKPGGGWNGGNVVETVLRGLRIIQIGQIEAAKPSQRRTASTPPGHVIFEVTPRQAEIVTLAERMGTLTFTLDSLRRGPEETAAKADSVVLAAARDPQTDPPDPPTGTSMSAPPAMSAPAPDPALDGQPSYMTDSAVSPTFVRTHSWDLKAAVTILRGGAKPDAVAVDLRCTETACAQFNQMPTKLVGTGQLAGSK
ncbi:MAG TPA: Flp pilus assembly protein CpaB [Stellaceae bacterium]|nr:Flp pilus assembly protein CpaB [Stellaceae bacterium]